MIDRIDAHHHLWRYKKEDYPWIGDEMPALARDFLLGDLHRELSACGIQGSVVVQARQSLDETRWLLDLASNSPVIRAVVGWAPIARPDFSAALEALQPFNKLKGLRHVVQGEPDPDFLLRSDFNAGISLLKRYGLVYDILIYERQLPATLSFVDRHPNQVFVLDHIAKPRIRDHQLEPWRTNIQDLARRQNVFCKLSGMVTEAHWQYWTLADLLPYLETVLNAFGPNRLMAGSDWPVCLLATTPQKWFSVLQEFIHPLSSAEQQMILGGVATKVYSLQANAPLQKP
jgi:L-fuconolactonase